MSSALLETLPETDRLAVDTELAPSRPWLFQKGHPGMGGRPKGVKNAAKLLDRAAPKIVRHYVKRSFQSDTVLIDAVKRIIPVSSDQKSPADKPVIVMLFDGTMPSRSTDQQLIDALPQPVVDAGSDHASVA